jgi:predicted metal-dependent phosphoesterase TrpH
MLRVEFHCHTCYSKDSLTPLESLLESGRKKGIDRLIITDHNTTAGALVAYQMDPQHVIVGEEIMTSRGELLAAFVQEEIPAGIPPQEALARLHEQGAFISVSHPFDKLRKGHWELDDLLAILPHVDAIETFNSRCMWPEANRLAQDFALQHHLQGTVGSDAHAAFELGNATLLLEDFNDAAGLRLALGSAKAVTRMAGGWVHMVSRYATWRKRRAQRA